MNTFRFRTIALLIVLFCLPATLVAATRVLVALDEQNLGKPVRVLEGMLSKDLSGEGYRVFDRTKLDHVKLKAVLEGKNNSELNTWRERLAEEYDMIIVGRVVTKRGETPKMLKKKGFTSVQARLNLRIYETKEWRVVNSFQQIGSGAHLNPEIAGTMGIRKAYKKISRQIIRLSPPDALVQKHTPKARRTIPEDDPRTVPDVREATPEIAPEFRSNWPRFSANNNESIAVIIGNRNYDKTKSVDFAINDATLVKTFLIESLGYREGNIFFVTDATKGDFELYFGTSDNFKGKLFNAVRKNKSDVFIYYSGHGAPGINDQKSYFVPVDAEPNYVELQGYPTELLYGNLSKVPARSVTLITDACFSGATYENISPVGIAYEQPAMKLESAVVLSSSQGSQAACWYNEKGHSLFTYLLMKGIHNFAADADKDDAITYEEWFEFVQDNQNGVPYFARRLHNIEQVPTMTRTLKKDVFIRK